MKVVGKIPVRSVWMLLMYASDFLSQLSSPMREAVLAGKYDADFLDPVAQILVGEVEKRLRQQLTFHYRKRSADVSRVRGRVNHLRTVSNRLMEKGRIACEFSELTIDSPRNRFIASALLESRLYLRDDGLKRRCANAAFRMQRLGVSPITPSRAELSKDRLGHHDASDRRMLDAAHLIRLMTIPAHEAGPLAVPELAADDLALYGRLFEKAVRNYFIYSLPPKKWTVAKKYLQWANSPEDSGANLLPVMETDIVLEEPASGRRIVIEAKFADGLIDRSDFGSTTVRSNYLYQLYAYLMSQTHIGNAIADQAEGVLLFPVAEGRQPIEQSVHIQGHRITFLSVDLSEQPSHIRKRWDLCFSPAESPA